jgi:hypothetical protein
VKGDSASRSIGRETWEIPLSEFAVEENITLQRESGESDRPIVARKRVMTVEPRGRSENMIL